VSHPRHPTPASHVPGRSPATRLVAALLLTAALAVTAAAFAQGDAAGADPNAAASPASEAILVVQLFKTNIYINGTILALSVIALLLFFFLLLTISSSSLVPTRFIDDIVRLLTEGSYRQASDLCRNHPRVFVASILQRCVDNADKSHDLLMDIADTEGRRRADLLWNRISYLSDISNIAPMFGLLGTVIGMIQAFFQLQAETASINSKVLSSGIGGALSTTMFGLIVGIGALIMYSIMKARATRALADAEQVTHSIIDMLKRSPRRGGKPSSTVADATEKAQLFNGSNSE